ncbi:CoA transferase [Variovorax sp. J22R115]|uniref:CoA transferase n=1 Tax=Variovorax sp. J22R115 TaxID=3053509 RepID=UPI0034DEB923
MAPAIEPPSGTRPRSSFSQICSSFHRPIEPQFFADLCEQLGVDPSLGSPQRDKARCPALRAELGRILRSRTRDEWTASIEGSDACFAPVLTLSESPSHPRNAARNAFVEIEGVRHPTPAPRFSRSPSAIQGPSARQSSPVAQVLERWMR